MCFGDLSEAVVRQYALQEGQLSSDDENERSGVKNSSRGRNRARVPRAMKPASIGITIKVNSLVFVASWTIARFCCVLNGVLCNRMRTRN